MVTAVQQTLALYIYACVVPEEVENRMEDGGWSKEEVSFVTLAKAGGRKGELRS